MAQCYQIKATTDNHGECVMTQHQIKKRKMQLFEYYNVDSPLHDFIYFAAEYWIDTLEYSSCVAYQIVVENGRVKTKTTTCTWKDFRTNYYRNHKVIDKHIADFINPNIFNIRMTEQGLDLLQHLLYVYYGI